MSGPTKIMNYSKHMVLSLLSNLIISLENVSVELQYKNMTLKANLGSFKIQPTDAGFSPIEFSNPLVQFKLVTLDNLSLSCIYKSEHNPITHSANILEDFGLTAKVSCKGIPDNIDTLIYLST